MGECNINPAEVLIGNCPGYESFNAYLSEFHQRTQLNRNRQGTGEYASSSNKTSLSAGEVKPNDKEGNP
jgi:hypothetical protein